MLTKLVEAIRHDPTSISVMVGVSKVLGQLIQDLQEQHKNIFTHIVTTLNAQPTTIIQGAIGGDVPIDKENGKRPMVRIEGGKPNKISKVQCSKTELLPVDQQLTVPEAFDSPNIRQGKCY
ncbi:hypothetical protein NE237_016522 [Protea cynaroides]|uniref:Uncharacterized protein n=1 Tax=Protea cynaroides TaxID=273540 RepID=A0A9Q0HH56_9MAGN|nr:hypothetical protein NE237_016522 [Protea cynaroides]